MNPLLDQLQPYPFARLREAMQGVNPPEGVAPSTCTSASRNTLPRSHHQCADRLAARTGKIPLTAGLPELRQACADWLQRRYDGLTVNPDTEVLPVLGSREALFSFVQTILNPASDDLKPIVLSPNPFYQIYEGAAILGGGEIRFANCPARPSSPIGKALPKTYGNASKSCSSARPTTPAVASCNWKTGKKSLICKTNTVSSSLPTNAIPKSISTATNP